MKHGSLFSGIGGFDLAAEWVGWENVFHCEINKFCQKVLKYHFPNAISYENIKTTDFTIHKGCVDIITGGFPCQPFSLAGKRLGKNDERHLWPEMLRAIREIQPSYIVGENVRGIFSWNGGMVFNEVCSELENIGYEVQPILLPACSVGAPHRRDRFWFVAYSNSNGSNKRDCKNEVKPNKTKFKAFNDIIKNDIKNSGGVRLQKRQKDEKMEREQIRLSDKRNVWDLFPLELPICSGNDGFSNKLDGITFSKFRQESLKAYGNAIVPQVVYQIFKVINFMEKNKGRN